MKQILIISILIISICFNIKANTFTVTNTNDSGTGSLREAIDYAIFTSGTHTIAFNIPSSDTGYNVTTGVWTIHPLTTYSYITSENITIDGSTQTTNQGNTNPLGPEIELDGSNNTIDYAFSVINVSNIHFKKLCVKDFTIGIQIFGSSSTNCSITGCYIGIDATSSDTSGNYIGIEIIGGPSNIIIGGTTADERNIVSGNEHIGIRLVDVSNNFVIGNYVGLDRTGMFAMGNYDGVSIEGAASHNVVGGINPGEKNIIAGNYAYGVPVFGAGCNYNKIIGNYIGVDVTGNNAVPNTYGVLFDDGAAYNTIGGNTSDYKNIISGNSGYGVFIYNMGTHNNLVKGNYIGTDPSGTTAIPNANGIVVDGAPYSNIIDSNLISGNLQQGIVIHITGSDSTIVTKNLIGTDITGTQSLGNGIDGVRIAEGPKNTIIGGSLQNANIIAFNSGNGVTVMNNNDDFNLISYNSIFSNGGLGIDLYLPGVNPNDAGDGDSGPNEEMNYPKIDTVIFVSGPDETIISGTIDTQNPETVTIQIFRAIPDLSGHGQGIEYLSSVTPDISGNWTDTLTGLIASDFLTTIAIDQNNNTSEFSITRNTNTIVSVVSNSIDERIIIYPNPTTGMFIVHSNETEHIEVIDIKGRVVKKVQSNSEHTVIDISGEEKGTYFIKITTVDRRIIIRAIVMI
jgi:hypothetical protein